MEAVPLGDDESEGRGPGRAGTVLDGGLSRHLASA